MFRLPSRAPTRAWSFLRGRIATRMAVTALVLVWPSVGAVSASGQSTPLGTWQVRMYQARGQTSVELRLEMGINGHDHNETSSDVPISDLAGLSSQQVAGPDGAVEFKVVRDAGTFACAGRAGHGRGAGTFEFVPNPDFSAGMVKRGYGRPTAEEQFKLALNDIGYALVDELKAEGYKRSTIGDLVDAGEHGVDLEFVKGLDSLGYRVGDLEQLVELRDHGVDPDYIHEMAAAGYTKLSPRELLELRDHGVDSRYIAELARAGYKGVSTEDLLSARDHGVKGSEADAFRRLGYTNLSLQDLVELQDHGVTPGFAMHFHRSDGRLPSVNELIERRDRGDGD